MFLHIFADDARACLGVLADGLGGAALHTHMPAPGILANAHVRFGDATIMVSESTPRRRTVWPQAARN